MAMKIERAASVEPQRVQTALNPSAPAATGSSKVSMFGVKSGFVIPKNKLSGSLVPMFRGAKKVESHDAGKEETKKQAQRKTKWGADLAQDSSVRSGRALAYQIRVEQITQQLKSGILETGEDLDSQPSTEDSKKESSGDQVDNQSQMLEALEVEKREAIGEILKLNPSYKAPPDYRPVLKEAKVPIPLKLYPGFNFISLLLGSGSNAQKSLQEETGAKICIQGTKAGEADKGDITLSDGTEDQSAYEELYVHVSADTFEKVDAAVALIELLVTPVSGNSVVTSASPAPVSGENMNVMDQSQNITSSYTMPAAHSGVMQPVMGSMQPSLPQVQFQPYPAPWFPPGPPQTPMRPPQTFGLPSNSSAYVPNNAIQYPPSTFNDSRMAPHLVGRPPFAPGFNMVPRNPSLVAARPQTQPPQLPQGLQHQYIPQAQHHGQVSHMRSHPIPGPQPPLQYPPSMSQRHSGPPPHQFPSNQHRTTGHVPVANQPFPMPQPLSTAPSGPPTNRPLASIGWPTASVVNTAPVGQSNMTHIASPMGLSQRNQVVSRPVVAVMSGMSANHQVFTQLPNTPVNRPVAGTAFSSVPPQVGPVPASAPVPLPSAVPSGVLRAPSSMAPPAPAPQSIFPRAGAPASSPAPNQSPQVAPPRPVGAQGPAPNPSMTGLPPVPLASPRPQPGTSNPMSVSLPNFTPVNPSMTSPHSISPVTAPKPQRPSSGDFTFQPRSSQPQASQTVARPGSDQLANAVQPPLPTPSYRPAMHNAGPQQVTQGFSNSRPSNQFLQPQTAVPPSSPGSVPFPTNQSPMPPPPRPPPHNRNSVLPASPVSQMGPRGFMQAPQMSNLPRPSAPQMANPPQLQQNQLTPTIRPGNIFVPNQQYSNTVSFSGKPASSPGGNQVYDPFSPTSISSAPQQADNPPKGGNHENDPEYNDLMASVGMR